jgi:mono/diheme cytochrome c family protein
MNKILYASAILLAIVITACGGQPSQTPPQPAPATETANPPTATHTYPPPATDAPAATETPAQTPAVSFANDIMPIFETSCNKCHGVEQIKEGLDMRTYESLMAGSFNGSVITPGNADESFLVQQIVEGEMPKRGPKLTAAQVQLIIAWINAGAINN